MGDVGNSLYCFFKTRVPHRVQDQGEKNRQGKAREDQVKRQKDGIAYNPAELVGIEKRLEMLKTDPLAAPDTFGRDKVFKGDLDPEHGVVMENKKIHKGQEHENMQPPVADEMFQKCPAPFVHHKLSSYCIVRV
jgi:hypothetical protein